MHENEDLEIDAFHPNNVLKLGEWIFVKDPMLTDGYTLSINSKLDKGVQVFFQRVSWTARDRGNWVFVANSTSYLIDIDGADSFPRYYFDYECMLKEIQAWLEHRKQLLPGDIRPDDNQLKVEL